MNRKVARMSPTYRTLSAVNSVGLAQAKRSPLPNCTRVKISTCRGFTLIEVVLAIAILAVMMTINYRILRGIVEAKRQIDDRREGMFVANSLLTRLSKELQLAKRTPLLPALNPTAGAGTPTPQQNVFIGTNSIDGASITFMAKDAGQYVPDGGTHSGLVQLRYFAAKDPEQKDSTLLSIVREEIPKIKPITRAYKNALRFPVNENLKALSFRYYDGQDKQWVDTWDDARSTRLPTIVEYTVLLESKLGLQQSYTGAVKLG
jgi:prepilin-type N-terminal cleavage/methylation domain-containing protein